MLENLLKANKYDPYFYNLYLKEKQLNNSLFKVSDNYFLVYEDLTQTVWVWNQDNLTVLEKNELLNLIKFHHATNKNLTFICKSNLYTYLKENFEETPVVDELSFMLCKNLNEEINLPDYLDKANYSDKMLLSKYYQQNLKETENINIKLNLAQEMIDNYLNRESIYILRSIEGHALSMLTIEIIEKITIITNIYTKQEERRKGYCRIMLYNLTKKLLENNLTPILITNSKNIPAITCYKKVGYQEIESLVNFKLH